MEVSQALKVIRILADGIDPTTGEVFDDDSPYQNPQVIRALFVAVKTLEKVEERQRREKSLPAKAGLPWSDEEDKQLVADFKQGVLIDELARKHQRTKGSIESRLVKHGLIEQKTT